MRKALLALPLAVAACTTAPAPPPPRVPAPKPVPVVVVPALQPRPADWRDRPYTPGSWHYADRKAAYGADGVPPLLVMQCDPGRQLVLLSVLGASPTLTVRTSYGQRDWPASPGAEGRSVISFAATDPALDQIAFSRGRFSISGPGLAEMDIPAWAEPSRVIEDCRSR